MPTPTQLIACLGPEGSFSHEFAMKHFGEDYQFRCVDGDFSEVVSLVGEGTCSYAVIPFLNSNGVDVRPAQIAIGQSRDWIWIEGCYSHLVTHNVVVTPHFKELKKVISKEQVFPQCTTWLQQWQGLVCENAPSTSAALRNLLKAPIEEQRVSGAICNLLAYKLYGGKMLHPKIENPRNTTLFLVIAKEKVPRDQEQVLICLTCPTEQCYKQAISEFAIARFPLKFSSLKGEFSEHMPCFLQFENTGSPDELELLLAKPHRHLIGAYATKNSLSTCIASFFDEDY
ncbi:prephenate dehydratase domain-containing protein [Luteolibacter algae]|uniref:prephenate dehydratase n=1 Tax=Luteolibacter algae TaxID=454151 RepID=A0ABW5D654_9BACT